ncbi:MAG: hypothetical protein M1813_008387 [Trichoglossum hirsutum]|nr:MAG: hypothetical protein M1813_008387 [Trichoglossum hirsutum]
MVAPRLAARADGAFNGRCTERGGEELGGDEVFGREVPGGLGEDGEEGEAGVGSRSERGSADVRDEGRDIAVAESWDGT